MTKCNSYCAKKKDLPENKKTPHVCEVFVVIPGFEPGTQGFSVLCSTN